MSSRPPASSFLSHGQIPLRKRDDPRSAVCVSRVGFDDLHVSLVRPVQHVGPGDLVPPFSHAGRVGPDVSHCGLGECLVPEFSEDIDVFEGCWLEPQGIGGVHGDYIVVVVLDVLRDEA